MRTVLPAPAVMTAGTTTLWPILARAVAFEPAQTGTGVGVPGVVPQDNAAPPTPDPVPPPKRSPAHYLWAVLIACIYEVFPFLCPKCGGQMRLIAFITAGTQIEKLVEHIGVNLERELIAPTRGPPLWVKLRLPLPRSRLADKPLAVG